MRIANQVRTVDGHGNGPSDVVYGEVKWNTNRAALGTVLLWTS